MTVTCAASQGGAHGFQGMNYTAQRLQASRPDIKLCKEVQEHSPPCQHGVRIQHLPKCRHQLLLV